MSENLDLKCCPHCGGEPKLHHQMGEYWVTCTGCLNFNMQSEKYKAVEAWNARVKDSTSWTELNRLLNVANFAMKIIKMNMPIAKEVDDILTAALAKTSGVRHERA